MNTNGVSLEDIATLPSASEDLSAIFHFINGGFSLVAAVLAFIACLIVGWVLKGVKRYPNDAIPIAVILVGALVTVALQPGMPKGPVWGLEWTHFSWTIKNIIGGCACGFIEWRFHKSLLWKFDAWVSNRFGVSKGDSDPAAFTKPPVVGEPTDKVWPKP